MGERLREDSGSLLKATDLFPDLDRDIDRRIAHSETRIKFWVIGGVLANVLVAMGAAIPIVYFLGQMQATFTQAVESTADANVRVRELERWASKHGYELPGE